MTRVAAVSIALLLGTMPLAAQQPAATGFSAGDRVLLTVTGEPTLCDTFTVRAGPALELPGIGAVPLAGVARDSLGSYLQHYLTHYLRDPQVQVTALTRLAVLGEVTHPGFYSVAPDASLADVMMLAGGPTQAAKIPGVRIERAGTRIWEGERLTDAMAEGRSVTSLGLESGDRIVVPRASHLDTEGVVRIVGILVTIPAAIFGLTHLL